MDKPKLVHTFLDGRSCTPIFKCVCWHPWDTNVLWHEHYCGYWFYNRLQG